MFLREFIKSSPKIKIKVKLKVASGARGPRKSTRLRSVFIVTQRGSKLKGVKGGGRGRA